VRWALLATALVLLVPAPSAQLASGTLSLTNSRAGGPIFNATNLAPGQATRGTVSVANSGSLPGVLRISQSPAVASPLTLTIRSAGSTVYTGPLAGLHTLPLGRLEPGAARSFEFTAALPASAGNTGQGQSTTVSYTWTAVETTALRTPLRLRVRVRVPSVRSGVVTAYASCDQTCWLVGSATVLGRRSRLVRSGRVRANREKRLVLRLPRRSVRATCVSVTVTGRTESGAHKTVRKRARIASARSPNRG
jgi:hypothetical protein